jgi:hypothetical protein
MREQARQTICMLMLSYVFLCCVMPQHAGQGLAMRDAEEGLWRSWYASLCRPMHVQYLCIDMTWMLCIPMMPECYVKLWLSNLCSVRTAYDLRMLWHPRIDRPMRPYVVLCFSNLMNCYDFTPMHMYATLGRPAVMQCYDVWHYAKIFVHMLRYVHRHLCNVMIQLICSPMHAYAVQTLCIDMMYCLCSSMQHCENWFSYAAICGLM